MIMRSWVSGAARRTSSLLPRSSERCARLGSCPRIWRPSLLLVRLCEILRAEQVARPSVDRLVRLVGWARERAHEQTIELLTPQLTDEVRPSNPTAQPTTNLPQLDCMSWRTKGGKRHRRIRGRSATGPSAVSQSASTKAEQPACQTRAPSARRCTSTTPTRSYCSSSPGPSRCAAGSGGQPSSRCGATLDPWWWSCSGRSASARLRPGSPGCAISNSRSYNGVTAPLPAVPYNNRRR